MNSLRVPLLASMVAGVRQDDLGELGVECRDVRPAPTPTRALTKEAAKVEAGGVRSRIRRRGPSPGELLGQDLPWWRFRSRAFSVETTDSAASVVWSCSSRVSAPCSADCTCVTALSAEREASARLSSTFQ